MAQPYPRDLVGYGRTPPHPRWPDEARIARAVRDQLRGGRREQHPARRRGSEAFLSEIVGAAALAGPAAHEHGVDLRVRLPRRLLAAVADVHRARHAGHRLRRRDGAAAQPGGGRRHEGGRAGRSPATASNGSTTGTSPRTRSGRTSPRRSASIPRSPASARSAGTPGRTSEHTHPARHGGGRLPLLAPIPTPTSCPIGSRGRTGRS